MAIHRAKEHLRPVKEVCVFLGQVIADACEIVIRQTADEEVSRDEVIRLALVIKEQILSIRDSGKTNYGE